MGYTHYFRKLHSNAELAEFAKTAANLSSVIIRGWNGEGDPEFTTERIAFNGDAGRGEDYESFVVTDTDQKYGAFCKTAYYPYDEVVVAVLLGAIRLKAYGYETISSDGSAKEWIESGGVELFVKTFKTLYPNSTPITQTFAKKVTDIIGGNPADLLAVQADTLVPNSNAGLAWKMADIAIKNLKVDKSHVKTEQLVKTLTAELSKYDITPKNKPELPDWITVSAIRDELQDSPKFKDVPTLRDSAIQNIARNANSRFTNDDTVISIYDECRDVAIQNYLDNINAKN